MLDLSAESGSTISHFLGFRYSEPPYFLLVVGLLVTLTCGLAFVATLKQLEQKLFRSNLLVRQASEQELAKGMSEEEIFQKMENWQLLTPFLGACAGICIFLASGLGIFGFPALPSYVVSAPLTALLGWLVWFQIGRTFGQRMLRSLLTESSDLFPTASSSQTR